MGAAMKGKPLTPERAAIIKRLLITTSLYQHEIAAVVGCNQGRVSKIKNRKRFIEVPPADESPSSS